MNESVTLRAAGGQKLGAYVAYPESHPWAALVVVQEIFGVNAHIRSVAGGYARDGCLAVAPALFDRIEPGIELGYEGDDLQKAMSLIPRFDFEKALLDLQAAISFARGATDRPGGVVGYRMGGSLAWLAACRPTVSAAVGYYAGRIGAHAAKPLSVPVMLDFGRQDTHIPAEEVAKVHAAHPWVEIYW